MSHVDVKFIKGMAAAQKELKDPPLQTWEKGYKYQQPTIDAVILLADADENLLYREATAVMQDKKLPATVLAVEYGKALRSKNGEGIEHFGYVDGRSQPDTGVDPVIGQQAAGEEPLAQQWPLQWGEQGKQAFDFGRFVTMKGGEFFFAPSLSFLKHLKKAD